LQFRHYFASLDGCIFACMLERRFSWAGVKLLGCSGGLFLFLPKSAGACCEHLRS